MLTDEELRAIRRNVETFRKRRATIDEGLKLLAHIDEQAAALKAAREALDRGAEALKMLAKSAALLRKWRTDGDVGFDDVDMSTALFLGDYNGMLPYLTGAPAPTSAPVLPSKRLPKAGEVWRLRQSLRLVKLLEPLSSTCSHGGEACRSTGPHAEVWTDRIGKCCPAELASAADPFEAPEGPIEAPTPGRGRP